MLVTVNIEIKSTFPTYKWKSKHKGKIFPPKKQANTERKKMKKKQATKYHPPNFHHLSIYYRQLEGSDSTKFNIKCLVTQFTHQVSLNIPEEAFQ